MTTLGYAILSLLARQPSSGYDIAQHLKVPIGFFWEAKHSQIYPELARLRAGGYVTFEVVEQQERPDKKVYSITQKGLEALREWATAPTPVPPARHELGLKAFTLWLADPRKAVALFREHERLHSEQLAEYEKARLYYEVEHPEKISHLDSPDFSIYTTLMRGIGYEREYAAWCGWVADRIEDLAHVGPAARATNHP